MKTIVVSGSHSNVGKTTLATEISRLLPGSRLAKIGHGPEKPGMPSAFYHLGTPFSQIARDHADAPFLIVEGNSLLREMVPDLAMFLEGGGDKPSAVMAREKADLRSHTQVTPQAIGRLSAKLGVSEKAIRKMVWLCGARPEKTSAIIMAGGKSRRMGRDKSALQIEGKPILETLGAQLAPGFDELILSVAEERPNPHPSFREVPDKIRDAGPLGGLTATLAASQNRVNFVVACDVPRLHPWVMRKLLAESEEYDVVVPSFKDGQIEPLFAVYTKNVLQTAELALQNNHLRLRDMIRQCRFKTIPFSDADWYVNLNTPGDLEEFIRNDPSNAKTERPG